MTDDDRARWTELGREVAPDGRIVYAWPPEGRFAEVWARFDQAFTDEDKGILWSLLPQWQSEMSTLVAYTNAHGEWVDVEPDWSVVDAWRRG